MATLEQKEELIAVLKFTPRTYKISMWGYGGERVMGTVSREAWDYCNDNQVDLSDISWNSDAAEDMNLDPDKLPFQPGSWYECDNIAHTNGVSRDSGSIQIEDENGETILEKELGEWDDEDAPEFECLDESWIGSQTKGTIVFIGSSNEKGTFFEGDIELTAPFDIRKLKLCYEEVDGEEIVSSVVYAGEDIDNYGGSTDGKSSDFTMVEIIDDAGNYERYSPEEKDWGHPEYGASPDDWEKSPEFKFNKTKPVYPGWYRAVWSNYGTSSGALYWDGKEFGEWEYGKFKPQAKVDRWQGYNWDTSNWNNRPPAPPDFECANTECGWVGMSEALIENSEGVNCCPNCGSEDLNWMNYDPDTKQGRTNRKKYCITKLEENK